MRGVPVCVDPYSLLSFGQDNLPLAAAADRKLLKVNVQLPQGSSLK